MTRHPRMLVLTAVALLCAAVVFPSAYLLAQQKPAPVLVHEVTSVELEFEKSNPPNALVKAKGKVTTGGYTNPQLVQVLYVMPPADGIQDLLFFVDPPPTGGGATQVITEVETPQLRIWRIPDWFKGVRVRAQTNQIEKLGH
jgi:hypothetical protein